MARLLAPASFPFRAGAESMECMEACDSGGVLCSTCWSLCDRQLQPTLRRASPRAPVPQQPLRDHGKEWPSLRDRVGPRQGSPSCRKPRITLWDADKIHCDHWGALGQGALGVPFAAMRCLSCAIFPVDFWFSSRPSTFDLRLSDCSCCNQPPLYLHTRTDCGRPAAVSLDR